MMPSYQIADLTPEQMMSIENLENNLGVTLIAWEPTGETDRGAATNDAGESLVLDALNDTYRTYDPHI